MQETLDDKESIEVSSGFDEIANIAIAGTNLAQQRFATKEQLRELVQKIMIGTAALQGALK